ncbi:MAG: TonB-dependent receptor [Bacteroidia bacterium]|jgi:outer membrane receptor for ferrienterochelin and colicin|nr:TonB-dependent receptor [Bacteroidia bacterium]
MKLRHFFIFLIVPFVSTAAAQETFTLSGNVKEAGSQELLLGVTIYTESKSAGTVTNNFGYYALQLPTGKHRIIYNFVGYDAVTKEVTISGDKVLNVNLASAHSEIGEVVVNASKTQKKVSQDVQMSTIEIPIKTIKDIPALFGEKDVLKVLQLMPGVQSGSEGQSGLYVRGGGPDQNLIILDGATVYNAQHLFGFFSLFNGDALRSVELIKGGFPARYGGRLSSVIDMNMKDGNKEKVTGELGIGVISSKGLIEGPFAKGKGSFIVSGRRTYIDVLTQPIIRAFNNGNSAGYYFYDLNAKANYEINDKNRVYLSGYFGRDKFYLREKYENSFDGQEQSYTNKVNFGWGNATGTARWNHLFGPKLFSNTSLIYSFYELAISAEEESTGNSDFTLGYGSGITDYTLKQDFDWYANNKHKVKFGLQATHHTFTPDALVVRDISFGLDIDRKTQYTSVETGLYIEDEWKISNRLKSLYGVRLSTFTTNKVTYVNPEPRVALAYSLKSDVSLKASYATMNQYVHLLSTSGVGLPTDLWVPATDLVKPQNSQQVAVGMAKDFEKQNFSLTVEGYYKTMNNIIGYKEGASFLAIQESDEGLESISWEENVTSGKGTSYGAEVLLQRKQGRLTGWAGYTLSWTTHQFDELNNGKKFFARYDRRHDISLVGVYELKENITLSATWVYGTGNAITLPISTYQTSELSNVSSPSRDNFYRANGTEYTDRNAFRMRAYHRADIGVQVMKQKKSGVRTWEFSVYNSYNRKNPFYYFIGSEEQFNPDSKQVLKQVSLFPILPSVSWNFKFN